MHRRQSPYASCGKPVVSRKKKNDRDDRRFSPGKTGRPSLSAAFLPRFREKCPGSTQRNLSRDSLFSQHISLLRFHFGAAFNFCSKKNAQVSGRQGRNNVVSAQDIILQPCVKTYFYTVFFPKRSTLFLHWKLQSVSVIARKETDTANCIRNVRFSACTHVGPHGRKNNNALMNEVTSRGRKTLPFVHFVGECNFSSSRPKDEAKRRTGFGR